MTREKTAKNAKAAKRGEPRWVQERIRISQKAKCRSWKSTISNQQSEIEGTSVRIPVRVGLVEFPGVLDHPVQVGMLRFPAQFLPDEFG